VPFIGVTIAGHRETFPGDTRDGGHRHAVNVTALPGPLWSSRRLAERDDVDEVL
jgi:hypothetical protein